MVKRVCINKCIYCLSSDGLTDEHALPYSMNGNIVLEKACCPICQQKIDKGFEHDINKNFYKDVRSLLKLKSRSKNYVKEISLDRDGRNCVLDIKIFGAVIDFPIINTNSKEICSKVLSIHLKHEKASIPGGEYKFTTNLHYYAFIRYLVKIAYCLLIFSRGIKEYNSDVAKFLLGETNNYPPVTTINVNYNLEGNTYKITKNDRKIIHKVDYRLSQDKKISYFVISLFSFLNGPQYVVEIKNIS